MKIRQAAQRLQSLSESLERSGGRGANIIVLSRLLLSIGDEIDHAVGDGDYYERPSWVHAEALADQVLG